jgi:hypothetical protein
MLLEPLTKKEIRPMVERGRSRWEQTSFHILLNAGRACNVRIVRRISVTTTIFGNYVLI